VISVPKGEAEAIRKGKRGMTDDVVAAFQEHLVAQRDVLNAGVERVFNANYDRQVPEVMDGLREMFAEVGMTPDDDFLRPYAEVISSSCRV
jgi:hypothetical protein